MTVMEASGMTQDSKCKDMGMCQNQTASIEDRRSKVKRSQPFVRAQPYFIAVDRLLIHYPSAHARWHLEDSTHLLVAQPGAPTWLFSRASTNPTLKPSMSLPATSASGGSGGIKCRPVPRSYQCPSGQGGVLAPACFGKSQHDLRTCCCVVTFGCVSK